VEIVQEASEKVDLEGKVLSVIRGHFKGDYHDLLPSLKEDNL
jgi:hypothetical protein